MHYGPANPEAEDERQTSRHSRQTSSVQDCGSALSSDLLCKHFVIVLIAVLITYAICLTVLFTHVGVTGFTGSHLKALSVEDLGALLSHDPIESPSLEPACPSAPHHPADAPFVPAGQRISIARPASPADEASSVTITINR